MTHIAPRITDPDEAIEVLLRMTRHDAHFLGRPAGLFLREDDLAYRATDICDALRLCGDKHPARLEQVYRSLRAGRIELIAAAFGQPETVDQRIERAILQQALIDSPRFNEELERVDSSIDGLRKRLISRCHLLSRWPREETRPSFLIPYYLASHEELRIEYHAPCGDALMRYTDETIDDLIELHKAQPVYELRDVPAVLLESPLDVMAPYEHWSECVGRMAETDGKFPYFARH